MISLSPVDPLMIVDYLRRLSGDEEFLGSVAAIRPGRFRRDGSDPVYLARARYTRELRKFVYNPAVLDVVLGDPELKTRFFRTFGYQGSTNFTIYPSCWIRDLPLLDLGEDVYCGDGIVLGTNQISTDQQTLTVGRICIGPGTVFDQQCMVGYGSTIGARCVLGIRVMIGMKATLGDRVQVRPSTAIAHHVVLEHGAIVGNASVVGAFSVVEAGVELPDYSRVPQFTRVTRSGMVPRRRVGR
jgi:carbonic anhydrase/acetyltransferase-like protein (isoleucine patch superfamily)